MALIGLLLFVALAVFLMVALGERFLRPASPRRMQGLQRWLVPLVGLALLLAIVEHSFFRSV